MITKFKHLLSETPVLQDLDIDTFCADNGTNKRKFFTYLRERDTSFLRLKHGEILRRIEAFLESDEPKTVEGITAYVGLSESHLHSIFNRTYYPRTLRKYLRSEENE